MLLEDIEYILKHIDIKMIERKTFLITGASGFLAGYIVEALIYINKNILRDHKCKILALSRNELSLYKRFGKYSNEDGVHLIVQDVEESINYNDRVDYIIHAASQANTKRFLLDPVGTLSPNVIGTFNLLKYSKNMKVKGFLFVSSGAVYGDSNLSVENKFIRENEYYALDPLKLTSSYAEGKRMGENMCYCFFKQFDIPTKIVRVGHTYGPGIDLHDGRVFSDFIYSILNNENLIINSDGKSKRPFCYISDAVIALFLVLFKGENGEAYNVANNECFVSINELADILTKKTFKEKNLKFLIKNNSDNITQNKQLSIDTQKLYNLGWRPKIDINEGFKRTVKSFLGGNNID